MEPITLAMVALTVVATKATEKVGETLGEGAIASAKRWLDTLRQHSPETVRRLEAASDPNVIEAEIIEEVKQVAAAQPDVQTAMEETAAAVKADQRSSQNLTKIADKAGNVFMGTVQNPVFNQTF